MDNSFSLIIVFVIYIYRVSNAKIPHVEFTICGVPSFWGEVLQGCSLLATRIDDEDVPILKCLTDVTLQMFSNAEQQVSVNTRNERMRV